MAQRNNLENHQGRLENGKQGGHVGVASEKVAFALAAALAMTGVASPVSAQGVETIDMGATAESPEAMMTRPVNVTYSLYGVTAFPNTLPGNTEIAVVISYTDPEGNPVQKNVPVMTNAEGTGIIFSPGDIPTDRIVTLMYAHTLETSKNFFLPENQVGVAVEASSMNRFEATITFETAGGNVTPHFAYLIFPDGTRVPLSLDGNNGIYTTKFKNPGGNPLPTGSAELVIEGTTQQDLNPTNPDGSMAQYTDKKMSFRAQSPVTIDTWATQIPEVPETQPKENTIPQGRDSYTVDIATPLKADDAVFLKSSDGTVLYKLNFSISGTTLTVYGLGNTSVGEYMISVGTSASDSTDHPFTVTPPPTIGVQSGLQEDFNPNSGSFKLHGMRPDTLSVAGKELDFAATITSEGFWEVTLTGEYPGGGVIIVNVVYADGTPGEIQLNIPKSSSKPQISIGAAGWRGVGSVMGAETPKNVIKVCVNGRELPEGAGIPEEWLVDGENDVTASMLKSPSDGHVITYKFSKEDLTQKAPETPVETLPETLNITQVIMPDGTVTLTVSNVENPGSTIFTFEIEGGGGKLVNNTGIASLPQGTKIEITAEKGGKKVSAKVTTDQEVLPVPSALTMTAVTDTIRDFTWSPVDGATGYIVEVNGTPVAAPEKNNARITLPEGENRVVTVRAVKKVGERKIISQSVSLEGITVRVTIPAPTGCYVSTNGDGHFTVTCKRTLYYGEEVTGYEFYVDGKLAGTSKDPGATLPQGAGGDVTARAVLQDASRTGTQDKFVSIHALAGKVPPYVPPVITPPAPAITVEVNGPTEFDDNGGYAEPTWTLVTNAPADAVATFTIGPMPGNTMATEIVTQSNGDGTFTLKLSPGVNFHNSGLTTFTIQYTLRDTSGKVLKLGHFKVKAFDNAKVDNKKFPIVA